MEHTIATLLDWIAAHQGTANLVVFTVAAVESLVLFGVFAPGALVLIGVGALIAVGGLEFWPIYWSATAGAILGESVSYWLGRHFKDQLRGLWPLKRYPEMLERGEVFFQRHGGKSVLFGRFIGPLRAVVPTVAGMMNMPAWRFSLINVLSALIWAPIYLLPGMVVGASMDLATAVAGRLALLLALALITLWLMITLVRRGYAFFAPRATRFSNRALAWGRRHPRLGRLTAAVLDPHEPEAKGLLILAFILITTAWLVIWALRRFHITKALEYIDLSTYNLFQSLHTPWGDTLLTAPALAGDMAIHLAILAILALWLLWRRLWLAAAHWLAAGAFALAALWSLAGPDPVGSRLHGFPPLLVICTVGFLSILIARELPANRRWLAYCCALLVASGTTLAQLYFGTLLLSQAIAAITIGIIWLILLGGGYRRHIAPHVPVPGLIVIPLITAIAVASLRSASLQDTLLETRALPAEPIVLSLEQWGEELWQRQPGYRIDLRGILQQPLNIQWTGDIAALRSHLVNQGWTQAPPLTWQSALTWLRPHPQVEQLPLPPQVHLGYHAALQLEYAEPALLLRLWPTNVIVSPDNAKLWEGYVSGRYLAQLTLLNLPRIDDRYDAALKTLRAHTENLGNRLHYRPVATTNNNNHWSGAVLLVWPEGAREKPQ